MSGGRLIVGLNISCSIYHPSPKSCWVCGKTLPSRRRKYCSDYCGQSYYFNHMWTNARAEAVRRAKGRCKKCGSTKKLEVNHIIPRNGRGYGPGCHHHQANLETLCHLCHVKVTNKQRHARAQAQSRSMPRI